LTSHHLFLVCFAGGELSGGVSAVGCVSAVWALTVGALTGDVRAVMAVEGNHWRQRQSLRMFVAVVGVANWQKRVTSW
jgi:hypothetical protein